MKPVFFAKATAKTKGEVYIYEAIGGWDGITAATFATGLKDVANSTELDFYVNSPGGNVFDGIAIYNQIMRHKATRKTMHVDGIAASIASVIIMAGTEIKIAANGTIMIHDPYGVAFGGAKAMRKSADALDQIRDTLVQTYVARTGGDAKQISDWMEEETWMNADDAIKNGFATTKTEEKAIKAEFPMLSNFVKVPTALKQQATSTEARLARNEYLANKIRLGASAKAA